MGMGKSVKSREGRAELAVESLTIERVRNDGAAFIVHQRTERLGGLFGHFISEFSDALSDGGIGDFCFGAEQVDPGIKAVNVSQLVVRIVALDHSRDSPLLIQPVFVLEKVFRREHLLNLSYASSLKWRHAKANGTIHFWTHFQLFEGSPAPNEGMHGGRGWGAGKNGEAARILHLT